MMLEAHCSEYALGGCLSQRLENSSLKPVAYYSRKLTGAEINYESFDEKLLAVIAYIKEDNAGLSGLADSFIMISEHMNLKIFPATRKLTE